MHVLREMELAEEQIKSAISGQSGSLNITAGPVWMKTILPTAITLFRKSYPGMELKLRTTNLPGRGLVADEWRE